MVRDNKNSQFVCHACVGDAYLKKEICRNGKLHTCMICRKSRQAIAFDDLCSRVHYIIISEFVLTDREPDSWIFYKETETGWIREGESMYDILDEMLKCGDLLIEAVKKELSSRYFSFDEMAAGEEDLYGDEVHYKLQESDDYWFCKRWSDFEKEICTRGRFFNSKAESYLDEIFCDLDCFQSYAKPLIREVGPGTKTEEIYRARCVFSRAEIADVLKHPRRELGAPSSRLTKSGRMNPRWISMFYGAFDPETCVAEVRPPTGSFVVLGKFTIVRKLQLLDIGALQHIFVKEDSFFDPEFRYLLGKAQFLRRLVDIMSRPILPSDEDYNYLPTQAAAEYLSEKMDPQIDGLIFPSSQCGGNGENVVLFRRTSSVERDGSDELEMKVKFGRSYSDEEDTSLNISLLTRKKRKQTKMEKKRQKLAGHYKEWSNSGRSQTSWIDIEENLEEKPTLRVDLDSFEVRNIQAVRYETKTHRVRRKQLEKPN